MRQRDVEGEIGDLQNEIFSLEKTHLEKEFFEILKRVNEDFKYKEESDDIFYENDKNQTVLYLSSKFVALDEIRNSISKLKYVEDNFFFFQILESELNSLRSIRDIFTRIIRKNDEEDDDFVSFVRKREKKLKPMLFLYRGIEGYIVKFVHFVCALSRRIFPNLFTIHCFILDDECQFQYQNIFVDGKHLRNVFNELNFNYHEVTLPEIESGKLKKKIDSYLFKYVFIKFPLSFVAFLKRNIKIKILKDFFYYTKKIEEIYCNRSVIEDKNERIRNRKIFRELVVLFLKSVYIVQKKSTKNFHDEGKWVELLIKFFKHWRIFKKIELISKMKIKSEKFKKIKGEWVKVFKENEDLEFFKKRLEIVENLREKDFKRFWINFYKVLKKIKIVVNKENEFGEYKRIYENFMKPKRAIDFQISDANEDEEDEGEDEDNEREVLHKNSLFLFSQCRVREIERNPNIKKRRDPSFKFNELFSNVTSWDIYKNFERKEKDEKLTFLLSNELHKKLRYDFE